MSLLRLLFLFGGLINLILASVFSVEARMALERPDWPAIFFILFYLLLSLVCFAFVLPSKR